jgi:hypothetical protein
MPKPNEITMSEVPDAELKEFLDEIAEENKFDVVSLVKDSATSMWTVKLKRKAPG